MLGGGLLLALVPRPQAADSVLGSWSGHSALVLGHMASGQLWGGDGNEGTCFTPGPFPATLCLCAGLGAL